MKSFKYMGKYESEESLYHRDHPENYVPFKEPSDMKKLAVIANGIAIGIMVVTFALYFLRLRSIEFNVLGIICSLLFAVPHEFIHGIFMAGNVFMYQNLKQGMLFVLCDGDMTKGRFVLVSLAPNIVFGFIPFILFMINPSWIFLGTLGALSIPMGAGDYINVYSALTQMPKGALTYLSGIHSYWYIKEEV